MNKKAIALLELTGGYEIFDRKTYETLSYYWTKTPIFNRFPVIDSSTGIGSNILEKTLYLLNKYYNEGYRIFLGFSTSTVLSGCLPWFREHPDVIGISPASTSDTLNFPKNVYRIQPTDQSLINSINNILQEALDKGGKIYYVYSKDELATTNLVPYLKIKYGEDNVKTFEAEPDGSNITKESMEIFYEGTTSVDVAIIYMFALQDRETYISLFNNEGGLDVPFTQYDIDLDFPLINNSTTTLKDKFVAIIAKSVTTSELWTEAFFYMKEQFSSQTLNCLFLITTLIKDIPIQNIYSYTGVLEFNENSDLKYYSYGLYPYTNEGVYFLNSISITDPLYGNVIFNVLN